MTAEATGWKAKPERGALVWFRAMLWIARALGRSAARLALPPIVAWYLLVEREARRVSRDFLGRALGRPARLPDVVRHLHCFASVVLDRLFVVLGRAQDFSIEIHRPREVEAIVYAGRGCLLFTSHLGSFEAMRLQASRRAPIKVLLDREQSRKLTAFFEHVNPALAGSIIDAGPGGPGVALAVKQALDEGHRVGVMADRARPGERTVEAEFFGRPAAFPASPWLLAAALKAPVVLAFGLFEGGNRYRFEFELFAGRLEIPRERRAEGLQACVARYAQRLEHHARAAPYNWFNFYDFWARPGA